MPSGEYLCTRLRPGLSPRRLCRPGQEAPSQARPCLPDLRQAVPAEAQGRAVLFTSLSAVRLPSAPDHRSRHAALSRVERPPPDHPHPLGAIVFAKGKPLINDRKRSQAIVSDHNSPTFATRRANSSRALIFHGGYREGRHHGARGHTDDGTSRTSTLGGDWAGRLIFSCWSRTA